jgi:hypothetical protein
VSRRAFSGRSGKKRHNSRMSEKGLNIGEDNELAGLKAKEKVRRTIQYPAEQRGERECHNVES